MYRHGIKLKAWFYIDGNNYCTNKVIIQTIEAFVCANFNLR